MLRTSTHLMKLDSGSVGTRAFVVSTPFRGPYSLRCNPFLIPKIKGSTQVSGLRLSMPLHSPLW